jgi:LmbE family N-acetylglucosaminyl deacetylase
MAESLEDMPEDWDRALAVAAHPDDLEYEAGGSIARWTAAGKEVTYLLASRGEGGIATMSPWDTARVREEEQRAGAEAIGAAGVEFLDHTDGVIEHGIRLRRDIAAAIRRHRPEMLIVQNHHYFWPGRMALNMADHRAVGLATLDAARDAAIRWIFPELLGQGLEPWTGIRYIAIACSPYATHAVDVTESLPAAIAALRKHHVYLDALAGDPISEDMADPEAWLTGQATLVSARYGGRLAEAFELFKL